MTDECVSDRGHQWYRIHWSPKRNRYERECSLMGCSAWQYLDGQVIAKKIFTFNEDPRHAHDFKPWNVVNEDTVDDNLFYYRNCKDCKTQQRVEDLEETGTWIYFPAEVAIRG